MLFLQIRQAEVALADGRLDEAYQLLQRSDALRSHRRGQALVTGLIDKYVDRAKAHLEAGRTAQALLDCEKAQQLGGNLDEVLELRNQIQTQIINADHAGRAKAKDGILASAVQLVDSAIGRQDLDRAVNELVRARANGCSDQRLRQLDGNVRQTLRSQVQSALDQGRLDQAGPLMDRLVRLDPEALGTQELARALEQAQAAWQAIDRGDADEACEILQRLQPQLPQAKWLKEALEHLEAAEESLRAVRTGPLGMLVMNGSPEPARKTGFQPVPTHNHGLEARGTNDSIPSKFLLQVDGAGSYLVVRQAVTTFGPISSSKAPDVGLVAEPGIPPISIERVEDDYFVRGAEPGSSKLLTSGERIALSPRCRLIFNQPNPSSTTAVLDLSAGRFPRADLRRVILLDRDLVIGPGSTAHIRIDQMTEPLVLNIREGRLWCRNQQINLSKPLSLSGVSFAVTVA